jgi:hypothetical protein
MRGIVGFTEVESQTRSSPAVGGGCFGLSIAASCGPSESDGHHKPCCFHDDDTRRPQ